LELNNYEDGFHKYYQDKHNVTRMKSSLYVKRKQKYKPSLNWDDSGSTFYVTHIREPIARAISHYKYSQRWSCEGQLMNMKMEDNSSISTTATSAQDDFVPTLENQWMSFEQFMYEMHPGNQNPGEKKKRKYLPTRDTLWSCSTNCYARWITGMYHPDGIDVPTFRNQGEYNNSYPNAQYYYEEDNDKTTITEHGRLLMSEAMKLFSRYDLIIVLEWLRDDPTYARKIEDLFSNGVRGLSAGTPTLNNNTTKKKSIQPRFCHKQSKLANQKLP
jgi:hypothetical protein